VGNGGVGSEGPGPGARRRCTVKDLVAAACQQSRPPEGLETGLYEVASFSPEIPNFPNGVHV
jgi:hypothetical protein